MRTKLEYLYIVEKHFFHSGYLLGEFLDSKLQKLVQPVEKGISDLVKACLCWHEHICESSLANSVPLISRSAADFCVKPLLILPIARRSRRQSLIRFNSTEIGFSSVLSFELVESLWTHIKFSSSLSSNTQTFCPEDRCSTIRASTLSSWANLTILVSNFGSRNSRSVLAS